MAQPQRMTTLILEEQMALRLHRIGIQEYGSTSFSSLTRMALQQWGEMRVSLRYRTFEQMKERHKPITKRYMTTVLLSDEQKSQVRHMAKLHDCKQTHVLRVVLAWFIELPVHQDTGSAECVTTS